jgi:hypothetical protein
MNFKDRIIYHRTTENRVGRKLLEKDIEAKGKIWCEENGWIFEKFSSPEKRSVPDRIITLPKNSIFPTGFIFFIEFKRPGKKATDSQMIDHAMRRELGCLVMVCDSFEETELALEVAAYVYSTGHMPELPPCLTV